MSFNLCFSGISAYIHMKSFQHSLSLLTLHWSGMMIPDILGSTNPELIINQTGFSNHCSYENQTDDFSR